MAISLINHVVADLCLGKPPLKSLTLSSTTTVAHALSLLKSSSLNFISVWSCHCHYSSTNPSLAPNHSIISDHNHNYHNNNNKENLCRCVGKIGMVDIICFLCKEDNLGSPSSALFSPLSSLFTHSSHLCIVHHVAPSTGLLEAIDLILQGAQNLVVPIESPTTRNSRNRLQKIIDSCSSTIHNGREYCWLTQEDVIQFLLSHIGLLAPIPNLSLESLGIIQTEILKVGYHTPAKMALGAIAQALVDQTSVGVVDEDGALVGEISPSTLSSCDETLAAAIMALSCGDLMAYIDWGEPHEDTIRAIKAKLIEKKLGGMLEMLDDEYSSSSFGSSSSSSDDESVSSLSPTRKLTRHKSGSYSARMVRKAESIVCHPRSSLIAVMIQAIAHRVNYVWVMEDDCTLVGIVTFRDMLNIFHQHLGSLVDESDF